MHEATDVLRREHRNISLVVQMAREILDRRKVNPDIKIRELPEMTNFFLRYADHLHHAKEETVLFPAMRSDQQSVGVIDDLLAEHQEIRSILAMLEQSVANGIREQYFESLQNYVSLIMGHVRKEDYQLFTRADEIFSPNEQHQLADQLLKVQGERMPDSERKELDDWREKVAGA